METPHRIFAEPRLIMVPLANLNPETNGVRKTNGHGIDELAASIAAEGLLQNLTVIRDPNGPLAGAAEFQNYQVIAGSRRLKALRSLVDAKRLPGDYEVPCRLIDGEQALSASLAENSVREQMHPADEFAAFGEMIRKGKSLEDIAASFGVTPLVVQRRLKLANVAPVLFEQFRQDKITLEQMMALAIVDDNKAQLRVWNAARGDWDRTPRALRHALTEKEIDAARDPLALFVGMAEYEKAGGAVHRDIFDDASAGFITDAPLLKKLAAAKLEKTAAEVRKEGWLFVDVLAKSIDNEYRSQFAQQRAQPSGARKPTDVERKRIGALTKESATAQKRIDELEKGEGQYSDAEQAEYGALEDRMISIGNQIGEIEEGFAKYDLKVLAQAGVCIAIDSDGSLDIVRGLVKGKLKQSRDAKSEAGAEKAKETAKAGESQALTGELIAHAQFAIAADMVATEYGHAVAIIALTHKLLIVAFYKSTSLYYRYPVRIISEHAQESTAGEIAGFDPAKNADLAKLAAERKAIKDLMPKKVEDLLSWLRTKGTPVSRLLAYCVAESFEIANTDAAPIAQALKLDMGKRWTAQRENYIGRVSSAQILGALKEAGISKAEIGKAQALKKSELIDFAQPLLKSWLPKALRF